MEAIEQPPPQPLSRAKIAEGESHSVLAGSDELAWRFDAGIATIWPEQLTPFGQTPDPGIKHSMLVLGVS